MKTASGIDYAVIAAYMALMVGIGLYSVRFNKGASDYFRGANRIPWLVAGLSAFMSGFSAWTFTGAAGLAYQHGVVTILLYLGNAATFLLGYWIFALRWRRARISTVMEYLVERFDEPTRQAFSWSTTFFHLFTGAAQLYGVGLFVASTCGFPLVWTIFGAGAVILAYCVVGGLWAVVITDFLQAVILMPFTIVMLVLSLARVGGITGLYARLPPELTTLHLTGEMNWGYVACWTVLVSFGYNTAAQANRYFSVDDEKSARKVALLCSFLFVVGAFIWFVPPLAMRVLYPDLHAVWPGLPNAQEASYAVASLTLLPHGLVGIMLAAMFSASMASLSGMFNVHAAVISKDIYQRLVRRRLGDRELLVAGWIATFGVGACVTALAMGMAARGQSIFGVMLTFNTVLSLSYGPPALLGLVVKRTPPWSGMLTFAVGLVLGGYGAFVGDWSLVKNITIIVPASCATFLLSAFFDRDEPAQVSRRDAFFERLATPVNVERELQGSADPTAAVFRFLSWTTAGVGLLSILLIGWAEPGERSTVVLYAALTLLVAAGLTRVGRVPAVARRADAA
jgi:solute:Na+ symporter, SSS family